MIWRPMVRINDTTSRSKGQRKANRRGKGNNKQKANAQHSLGHLRQRISYLMSIFSKSAGYIPLPGETAAPATPPSDNVKNSDGNHCTDDSRSGKRKGKVWSNRNYGADKKRQRKQTERCMLETRIAQLEIVLTDEYGMTDLL